MDQVQKLSELRFFGDWRVELIDGVLFEMTTNPPHAVAVELAMNSFIGRFGGAYSIRVQLPLDFGRRSLPEPDLAMVAGTARDFAQGHPKTALLLIEIRDSTPRKDRLLKAHLSAHAGIADYGIVNLNDRQVEVHRNPGPDPSRKGRYRYADVTIVPADGHASPIVAPDVVLAVADLLP